MQHSIKSIEKLRLWRQPGNLNPSPQWVNNEEGIPEKVLNTKLKGKCQRTGQERCHVRGRTLEKIQAEELSEDKDRQTDNIWLLKDPDESGYVKRRFI
jgi:hypothetical protein